MEENGALSSSMLVPFRLLTPGYSGGDSSLHRQLAVVPPTSSAITTTSSSRFRLPVGWDVKNVIRSDGSRIDKYYYERRTGLKFRSRKEVERYLTGVELTPPRKAMKLGKQVGSSGSQRMVVSGGMLLSLDKDQTNHLQLALMGPTIAPVSSPFILPDGWVVEKVPRRSSGTIDKYYIEPGTGRKFRSLISVERYLAEVGDNAPLAQVFNLGSLVKHFGPRTVSGGKVNAPASDYAQPPARINWVLADPGRHTWNPVIGESVVPEPIKQRWANRFMLSVNDPNCAAPDVAW